MYWVRTTMLYDVWEFPFGFSILFGVLRGDVPRFWVLRRYPFEMPKVEACSALYFLLFLFLRFVYRL